MLTVILSWCILFIVFLSFGDAATRIWNKITRRNDSYSITDKFWIGICFIGTLLIYASLFLPLNIWILIAILILASINIVCKRDTFRHYLGEIRVYLKKLSIVQKVLATITFAVILIYTLCPSISYDQSLYHLQSIKWIENYPTVVGLGNLHGRLGFNSTFLLLATVFNYHPESYHTVFTLNGLFLLILSFWILHQIRKSENIFEGVILTVVLFLSIFSLGESASSTSTDTLSNILIIYLLLRWILVRHEIFSTTKPLLIAFLAAFCITLKLSSAPILLAVVICFALLWKQKDKLSALSIIGLGLVIAIPWLVKFVMLTGYLVYPFPAIDIFSVDWKMPINFVVNEKDSAYAWARIPRMDISEVMSLSYAEWIPMWLERSSTYVVLLFSTAILSPILVLIQVRKIKDKTLVAVWLVAYVGVLFNSLTAPDIRFAFGSLICAIVIPLMLFFEREGIVNASARKIGLKVVAMFVLACLVFLSYISYNILTFYKEYSSRSTLGLLYRPVPMDTTKKLADIIFKEFDLNGVTLYVPQATDQCADQELPCTPYFNDNLEMRGNDIRDGFRIKK